MTIAEYLESVKTVLLTNPLVNEFKILRERATATDGYLRVRLQMVKEWRMEFSEYVNASTDGKIEVVTYSYHCTDKFGRLVVRFDNAPHFPDLSDFPHHQHIGDPEIVKSNKPVNIFLVIDMLEEILPESKER